jgi:hypothetical protein
MACRSFVVGESIRLPTIWPRMESVKRSGRIHVGAASILSRSSTLTSASFVVRLLACVMLAPASTGRLHRTSSFLANKLQNPSNFCIKDLIPEIVSKLWLGQPPYRPAMCTSTGPEDQLTEAGLCLGLPAIFYDQDENPNGVFVHCVVLTPQAAAPRRWLVKYPGLLSE